VTDQPYLPGEVEVLDALIDLYPDPAPDWTDDEWELRMCRAVARARLFYDKIQGKIGFYTWDVMDDILDEWVAGEITRTSLHQALCRSKRYLKRYYERVPKRRGGC